MTRALYRVVQGLCHYSFERLLALSSILGHAAFTSLAAWDEVIPQEGSTDDGIPRRFVTPADHGRAVVNGNFCA